MKAEDVLGFAIPAMYVCMAIVEKIWPARQFPKQRFWHLIGFAFFVVMMTGGILAPLLLPVEWLAKHRLLDGTKLGVAGGAVLGIASFTFVGYWYHRMVHRSSLLWRWTHQIHHAPKRLDIPSAVMFHPTEVVIQNVLQIGILVFVLGIDPLAAAITGVVGAFFGMMEHWNVRTPRWIGWFFVRPEAHAVHHQRDVHAFNYSDLPLWDILFGTFKNPATFDGEVGFAQPAPMLKMLAGVDVHAAGTPSGAPVDEPAASAAE